MEWIRKNLAVITVIAGLIGGWATMNYRLDSQDKAIEKLETRQNSTDLLLGDINKQLADMNAKLSLIVEGKVSLTIKGGSNE